MEFIFMLIGTVTGVIVTKIMDERKCKNVGTINIIHDEDGSYIFANMNRPVEVIANEKEVKFYVSHE